MERTDTQVVFWPPDTSSIHWHEHVHTHRQNTYANIHKTSKFGVLFCFNFVLRIHNCGLYSCHRFKNKKKLIWTKLDFLIMGGVVFHKMNPTQHEEQSISGHSMVSVRTQQQNCCLRKHALELIQNTTLPIVSNSSWKFYQNMFLWLVSLKIKKNGVESGTVFHLDKQFVEAMLRGYTLSKYCTTKGVPPFQLLVLRHVSVKYIA